MGVWWTLTGSVFLKADSEIEFREGDDDKGASLELTIMEGKGRNQKWAEEEATLLWSLDRLTRPRESAGARVTLRSCPASEQSKWALIVLLPSCQQISHWVQQRWELRVGESGPVRVRVRCGWNTRFSLLFDTSLEKWGLVCDCWRCYSLSTHADATWWYQEGL